MAAATKIGGKSFDEWVSLILKDKKHPLHAKALTYRSRMIAGPSSAAAQKLRTAFWQDIETWHKNLVRQKLVVLPGGKSEKPSVAAPKSALVAAKSRNKVAAAVALKEQKKAAETAKVQVALAQTPAQQAVAKAKADAEAKRLAEMVSKVQRAQKRPSIVKKKLVAIKPHRVAPSPRRVALIVPPNAPPPPKSVMQRMVEQLALRVPKGKDEKPEQYQLRLHGLIERAIARFQAMKNDPKSVQPAAVVPPNARELANLRDVIQKDKKHALNREVSSLLAQAKAAREQGEKARVAGKTQDAQKYFAQEADLLRRADALISAYVVSQRQAAAKTAASLPGQAPSGPAGSPSDPTAKPQTKDEAVAEQAVAQAIEQDAPAIAQEVQSGGVAKDDKAESAQKAAEQVAGDVAKAAEAAQVTAEVTSEDIDKLASEAQKEAENLAEVVKEEIAEGQAQGKPFYKQPVVWAGAAVLVLLLRR